MTDRLYYTDSYRQTFRSQLLEALDWQGQPAVRLSRSAFYPTSGGQPHDTGELNGIRVVDVQVGPGGDVLHLLARPLPDGTTAVSGRIDWPRRYDHMQQHSGQHLLSQAFYRLLGRETVAVHFGEAVNTLDLDGPLLTSEQLAQAELAANQTVWQNRPIRAYWVAEAELAKTPLRRPPKVSGQIRIVEIDKFDWSACGGTHLRRTGEIGLLSLLRVEKHRGKSRVHFVCGRRALLDASTRRGLLAEAANLLDAGVEDVPSLLAKQQAALGDAEKQVRAQEAALLQFQAQELLAGAEFVGDGADGVRLVAHSLADGEPAALQALASGLVSEPGVVALLGCPQRDKASLVFARSADVSLHAGGLLRDVLGRFGGGGGGRPDFAQGGGVAAEELDAALAAAAVAVRAQLLPGA